MRIASLLPALLSLLPTVSAAADTPGQLPQYQVELVLFLRDSRPGGEYWPADVGQPDASLAVTDLQGGPPPSGAAGRVLVTPLSEGSYRLKAQAEALRRQGMTPLLHTAWRQPVGDRKNPDWLWLKAGPVSGLVRISLGRFLHIDTDLALNGIRAVDHRRMRSGELHYLDHPAFGILVTIDPYQAVTPPALSPASGPAPAAPAADAG